MTPAQFAANMTKASNYGFAKQNNAIAQAGLDFQEAQGSNFDRAEDSQGNAWPAHAPLTIALYGPHPLLILSGDMKRAATGGAGAVFDIRVGKKKSVVILGISKVAIPYAWKHQHGSGRIPRREFFYLPRQARTPLVYRFRKTVIAKVKADLQWP